MSSGAVVGHSPQITASFPSQVTARGAVHTTCPTGRNRDPSGRCRRPFFPNQPRFARVALNFSGSNGRKSAAVVRTVKKNSFNKRRAQEYELLAESIEGLWFQAELALALAFGPGKS